MDRDVAYRSHRQIVLQRLPMLAIVERKIDTAFRTGVQQTWPYRIRAHDVDGLVGRNAGDDRRPRFAAVARAVDVRMEIVEPMTVDRGIRAFGRNRRRFDNADFGPVAER